MRTEKCKKEKKTELEKFRVTLLSQLACTRYLSQHTAPHLGGTHVKPKEPESRSFSNKFHCGTEQETKLMPERKTPNENVISKQGF